MGLRNRQRTGNPNCITEHPVRPSGGTQSSAASATTGKFWGWVAAGEKSDGGNPHTLQHGIQSMGGGSGEPPYRRYFHCLAGGGGMADQGGNKLRTKSVKFHDYIGME